MSRCVLELTKENAIMNSKQNGIPTCMLIENMGLNLLKELCSNHFKLIKTRESCEVDVLAKPINTTKDEWLKIQLKVTNQNYYAFHITGEYKNMITLCISVSDKKIWLFEPHNLKLGKLTITANDKSKYNCYEIKNIDNINNIFNDLYIKQSYNTIFEEGNTPQPKNCILEYEFVKHRKNKINFLNFIDSEIDGLVYDFKINELKIQEKIFTTHKSQPVIMLHKSRGHNNKKRVRIPYSENDNDFYWFNEKNKIIFYVIPKDKLIEKGFISTTNSAGKVYLNLKTHQDWLSDYEFDYDTINEEPNKNNLLKLLNQQNIEMA